MIDNIDDPEHIVKCDNIPIAFPAQHQNVQPAMEYLMKPRPIFNDNNYIGSNKLYNKVALITGGDSGIGRAIAVAFAKEGANVTIVYYNEHKDAMETQNYIEQIGQRCLLINGDLKNKEFCDEVVEDTIGYFNKLDILVNNAGVAYFQQNIENISSQQLENTFRTNLFPMFYLVQACLPYLQTGSTIINTASSAAYSGYPNLIDYAASKAAVVNFTKSLALNLVDKGIRVNAVAPGPTWTPLITASVPIEVISTFGYTTPMKRAAQPFELAPAYVYLASGDSSYVTGQVLHVDGGLIMD